VIGSVFTLTGSICALIGSICALTGSICALIESICALTGSIYFRNNSPRRVKRHYSAVQEPESHEKAGLSNLIASLIPYLPSDLR